MSSKIKTIIAFIGLALSILGLVLIYQDFAVNRVRIFPISLFAIGIFSAYKVLAKTNHKSRKFKLKDIDDDKD